MDYNFFGHQLSLHIGTPFKTEKTGQVGGHMVPMPHFGVIFPMRAWNDMAKKLTSAGVEFLLKPQVRFKGETGEQSTMFFNDPFGNPIEIKGFVDFAGIHRA